MFKRVLIANRGEIAVRVHHTLEYMGFEPVVVFSEADRSSLHVLISREAYFIGPSPPLESYLNMDRIVALMKEKKIEAVHPGYGFLSENPDFAGFVEREGLIFIGPPEDALRLSGNKVEARNLAIRLGVPVVPGSERPLKSFDEVKEVADRIGYPILLKAPMGGGGKGMRMVRSLDELEEAFRLAREESLSAFGDDSLYVEKFIEEPHHVEIQTVVTKDGRVYTLGERECSIQRRHQKIVEESPSPFISDRTRKMMEEAAAVLMKEAGYVNAGTVEFLVDSDENFYFLEINARLQVEHPVTEMRFQVDLVRAQMLVAMGIDPFKEGLRKPEGHVIEVRVYAEDPDNDFFPSPGPIKFLVEPKGPYIRVDSGVYPGFEVPHHYDPLLSKIIVWGKTREEAVKKMRAALNSTRIIGIKTNLNFHRWLFEDEDFVRGDYNTRFIEKKRYKKDKPPLEAVVALSAYGKYREGGAREEERGGERVDAWWYSGLPGSRMISWEEP